MALALQDGGFPCVLNLALPGCLSHTIHTLEIHCIDFQSMPSEKNSESDMAEWLIELQLPA